MAGNSSRKGAVRGSKKGQKVGSGGKGKAKLAGRGPTPKASDRPYHPAAKAKAKAAKKAPSRSTAGTKSGGTGAGPSRGRSATGSSKPVGTRGASASKAGRAGSSKPSPRTGGSRSPQSRARSRSTHEWISGRNAVLEALQADVPVEVVYVMSSIDVDDRVREILNLGRRKRLQILEVSRTDLDRMTTKMVHQGVAAKVPAFAYADPGDLLGDAEHPTLIVAVDGITDPRNLGAIIRSAAAFDSTGVVVPQRRAVGVTPATWKTSAGAAARVKVAQATNLVRTLQDYQRAGCFVIGLAGDGDSSLAHAAQEFLSGPAVIVVGAEGAGLSRLVRETCDVVANIPIAAATESLNAAVATSIALYEAARAR
ncbi:MAG: 23S rRNA (guanosine(2251)-2'-O)-methyltransferase RlmB [Actinobacteria bacterium]|nr:23S rRNA (guanosine(2251)-2'-O)-methyltransferase RlmB [Actinomycetota bacterium]